jgi:hypothetical protein
MSISHPSGAARCGAILGLALALVTGCASRSSLLDGAATDPASGPGGAPATTLPGTGGAGPGTGGGPTVPSGCAWSERFGDEYGQHVLAMAVDASNATYLAGLFQGTLALGGQTLDSQDTTSPVLGPAFLLKLDASGTPVWSKVIGAPADAGGVSVAVDPAGNVLFGVITDVAVDLGAGPVQPSGPRDAILTKLTPEGKPLWSRSVMKPTADVFSFDRLSLGVDPQGHIVASGVTGGNLPYLVLARIDPDGGDEWAHSFLVKGGSAEVFSSPPAFDAQGSVTFAFHLIRLIGEEVLVDLGDGDVVAQGPGGVVVARFDASGNHLWSRLLDELAGNGATSSFHVWPAPLVAASGGGVHLATTFWGTMNLGLGSLQAEASGTVVLAELDAAGHTSWNRTFGAGASLAGLARAPGDRLLLSGYLTGSVDFGGGALSSADTGFGMFVASLEGASGAHVASRRFAGSLPALDTSPFFFNGPLLPQELGPA